MAKKSVSKKAKKTPKVKTTVENTSLWSDKSLLYPLLAILLITCIAFAPSINNDFVNWDDDVNITENPNLVAFDMKNIKGIFTDDVIGNYNPLTIFTFAVEKAIFGLNPMVFHINNLLLHLFCVFFVYRILLLLRLSPIAAAFAALLFGIHPMRVESVAWVTERKDVLMGAFYFPAMYAYIKYIKSDAKQSKWYVYSIVLFVFALLSKIQSVALPLSLMALDYYFSRPLMNKKVMLEKIPFFLLSLFFGLLGIWMLSENKSLDDVTNFSFFERLLVGALSLCVYFIKWIFPWKMSALYPYPKSLDISFYVAPLGFFAMISVLVWAYLKDKKWLVFGIGFFFVNVVFMLQILGAGQGFLADRFTYIPYLGLFFLMAYGMDYILQHQQQMKSVVFGVSGIYLLLFAGMTWQQNKVWKNGETLWTNVMKHYQNVTLPFGNRGHYYRENGMLDKALIDYNKALSINPNKAPLHNSRGKLYFDQGKAQLAMKDYDDAIRIDPELAEAYINRGAAKAMAGQTQQALTDLNKGIALDPEFKNGYLNRSLLLNKLQKYNEALADYNSYLALDPYNHEIIYERGLTYRLVGKNNEALVDLNKAIQMNNSNAFYFMERARIYKNMGRRSDARQEAEFAKRKGYKVEAEFYEGL